MSSTLNLYLRFKHRGFTYVSGNGKPLLQVANRVEDYP